MYTGEYKAEVVDVFKGLFVRGGNTNTPLDHMSAANNVVFGDSGQTETREAIAQSFSTGHTPTRVFLSTINSTYRLLTCNGAGVIYANGSAIYTAANLVDFTAINIFNTTVIAPLYTVDAPTNVLLIYNGTTVRAAAGAAPTSSFSLTEPAVGNVSIGVHKFAVCFVTASSFTTPPGPKISGVFTPVEITSTGSKNVRLTGIPTGPAGTTKRIILATKSNLDVYYYVNGGTIDDNTTTTLNVNFFDTDLAVSADSLFDLLETVPLGYPGFGGLGLQKYKGRLVIVGGTGDRVYISESGDAESFSAVTGQINITSENDGNQVRAAFEHYDVLYLTKAVGIYAVNGSDDSDPSTWRVVGPIEGAVGAYHNSIGSITQSVPGLTTVHTVLIACRSGIFAFNGGVDHPSLTWKIQDVWDRITPGTDSMLQLVIDPFKERIYALLCADGSVTPNLVVCGCYRNGLSKENIYWSTFSFPFTPKSIAMLSFNDGSDFAYRLRIGMNSTMYKLTETKGADLGIHAVNSYVQTSLFGNASPGVVDVFRFLRFAIFGSGTASIAMYDQYETLLLNTVTQGLVAIPGIEYIKEFNLTVERLSIRITVNTAGHHFNLSSLAVLHKLWLEARPNG